MYCMSWGVLYRWRFVDTCEVTVIQPARANLGTNDMFFVFLDVSTNIIEIPLNLPQAKVGSRDATYVVSFASANSSVPLIGRPLVQNYIAASKRNPIYALPYLPFWSNCRGFGAYTPLYMVTESTSYCQLFDPSATITVNDFNLMREPGSDLCAAAYTCSFEEDVNAPSLTPRWYEMGLSYTVFHIDKIPMSYSDVLNVSWDTMTENFFDDINNNVFLTDDIYGDKFVHVSLGRDFTGSVGLPRSVTVTLTYQQMTPVLKRMIYGVVYLTDYDPDRSNLDYTLAINFTPMGWMDLFNRFAFGVVMYSAAFFLLSILQTMTAFGLWTLHRAYPLYDVAPFRVMDYFLLTSVPPMQGIAAIGVPVTIVIMLIDYVFITRGIPDSVSVRHRHALFEGEVVTLCENGAPCLNA
jgi:hypothetical protein